MKLVLIAANPEASSTLTIEKDITALQRVVIPSRPAIEFFPLPHVPVEDLQPALREIEPNVVHVTAHGATTHLVYSSRSGEPVKITAGQLLTFLSPRKMPRLIYFSGCKSAEMAEEVAAKIDASIGDFSLIANGASRAASVIFYESILRGDDLQKAFGSAAGMAKIVGDTELQLYTKDGIIAHEVVLIPQPKLVAKFSHVELTRDRRFRFRLGVENCPGDTKVLAGFVIDDTGASVVSTPEWSAGVGWVRGPIHATQDSDVLLVGKTASGRSFTVEARLSGALLPEEMERWPVGVRLLREHVA